jgi:DnaK suppressor protein
MPSALTAKAREEIKSALQRERQSLRRNIRSLDDSVRTLADGQALEGVGQLADVASDQAQEEINLTLENASRAKLAEVDAAIDRLNGRAFGICQNCGNPIPVARLKALPWTTLCIACASER